MQELIYLEEDERALEEVYPQGEKVLLDIYIKPTFVFMPDDAPHL